MTKFPSETLVMSRRATSWGSLHAALPLGQTALPRSTFEEAYFSPRFAVWKAGKELSGAGFKLFMTLRIQMTISTIPV